MTQNTISNEKAQEIREQEWTDTLERIRERELAAKAQRAELFAQYRAVMIETFTRIGLKEATAYFDGCGDGGMVEEIRVPDGFETDLTTVAVSGFENITNLHDFLKVFAYEILEDNVGGWEINAGAFGDVEFNCDGYVRLDYNGRIDEIHHEEYTIFEEDDATTDNPEILTEHVEMKP